MIWSTWIAMASILKKFSHRIYSRFVIRHLSISNSNLNLYSWFNGDGGDLLDDLRRRMQINDTLVNAHLEAIPSLGTFTTRSLSGGDPQGLGWHTHRSFDLQFFILGSLDEVVADLFETLHISGSQGDPDTVNWPFFGGWLSILIHRHV